jgi:basic membrane protein A
VHHTTSSISTRGGGRRILAGVAVAVAATAASAVVGSAALATSTSPGSTAPVDSAPAGSGGAATIDLDTNGDGVIRIAVATPGPRDDGAYYQALVDGVEALSEANGFEDPIIVDNIDPATAETELRNLARQDVDIIAVGAGELSDPLPALSEEFSDVFWYCNCGAGLGDQPYIAQARDDSSQISYTAGFATGLLLADPERNPDELTDVAFLGCCDLDFETEALLAFEQGLQAVDEGFTVTYIPTGDFNDVAGATEAYNQAVANGAGAVYPFLGGSHEAIVGLANEDGLITMSAGSSDACEREDLTYDIAVQFDGGDYVQAIFEAIVAGELNEGGILPFNVGEFEKVGAKFCDATDEQVAALDEVRAQIAAGDFVDQFNAIKAEAYGFATESTAAPATTSA